MNHASETPLKYSDNEAHPTVSEGGAKHSLTVVHASMNIHTPQCLSNGSGASIANLVVTQLQFLEGGVMPVGMPS
jgi:hypothetical protein